ncbi:MAG: threonyl-tRNA synthetase [Solirubrobacteraceae bacterium]|jgi:threonyl-tRNA synthetase|nr:threonyl-tRNA synthetase [Solirubrobacteraceae bacterium]
MEYELPDGNVLALPDGATGADAAAAIGPGLARAALAVAVDGEVRDLARPLPPEGGRLEVITEKSGPPALALIRHDAAHVLAEAVMELYPGVKISIGPPIEDGFYYDFEFPEGVSLSDADFEPIEARMREHVDADEPFVRQDVSVAEALERFRGEGQDYKVELIEDLARNADPDDPLETVSLYTNGPFTDLCRGPHAPSTKRIKTFKLQSVAGAYWRGDARNQMLTRVYGTAFFSARELEEYLERLERARANDHRKLGPQLGLFNFSDVAPGMAFWLPNGTRVYNELVKLSREMGESRGYTEVNTPQLYDSSLWKTSGHWDKYRENMFLTESEGRVMAIKPMNCPGHCQLYSLTRHSYRDLPVRYSEPGQLHRNEPSGTLHGLLRVRRFAQDDAHIYCTEDQIQAEVAGCLEFAFAIYEIFGLDVRFELSTRPEQRIGSDELWDTTEAALASALESHGLKYEVGEGEGVFYGPKIDIHMTDSLGRSWQLGTVQLDYNMPARFNLTYTGADNAEHTPVMIHRALMGSYERFIGILLEHLEGELPVWLAPVQASVLPIADRNVEYAAEVVQRLKESGVRAELDDRVESVGRKIRDAELSKIPYMLVVGDREQEAGEVSLREHRRGDTGSVAVEDFIERVRAETINRRS